MEEQKLKRYYGDTCMNIGLKNVMGNFSLRAAALIIDNGQILLAKSDNYDCFYTVGGGIKQNETSQDAVLRECYEETGVHFEIDRLVFVQERFYTTENTEYHEVVFFYLMKKNDIKLYCGVNTDQNNEHLYWVPIEELQTLNIAPAFLSAAVKNIPTEVTHIVSYE